MTMSDVKTWAKAYAMMGDAPHLQREALYHYIAALLGALPQPETLSNFADIGHDERTAHFNEVGEFFRMVAPLMALQEALRQAENGEVPNFLGDVLEAKTSNRRPDTRSHVMRWAKASAVVTVLQHEYAMGLDSALKKVCGYMGERGLQLPTSRRADRRSEVSEPFKTFKAWRAKCMSGGKGAFAKGHYDMDLSFMRHGQYPQGCGLSRIFTEDQLLDVHLDTQSPGFDPLREEVLTSLPKPPTV